MRIADAEVTGKLIDDPAQRRDWLRLIQSLQMESEAADGRLTGWVFHGTDEFAANSIRSEGLVRSFAIVETKDGNWEETTGTHFGTANVAAFFAEDRIESLEDGSIGLSIFAARVSDLERLGAFAIDGQMIDCPLFSRFSMSEEAVESTWKSSSKTWQDFFSTYETIVLLADVPSGLLHELRCEKDLEELIESINAQSPRLKNTRP